MLPRDFSSGEFRVRVRYSGGWFSGGREAGLFTLPVDLSGLQSGVYLCAARASAYSGSTRIVTLK